MFSSGGCGGSQVLDQVTEIGATTTIDITVGVITSDNAIPGFSFSQSAFNK